MAENVILAEQTFEGFAINSFYGAYVKSIAPSPFELVEGQEYQILWDDVEYTRTAFAFTNAADSTSCIAVGNKMVSTGVNDGDIFTIINDTTNNYTHLFSAEDKTEHTVAIYQAASEEVGIVVTYHDGEEHTHTGLETVTFNRTDGGVETFTKGEVIDPVEVELDFSDGDITVEAADRELIKSVAITKPVSLVPENILKDVNIAGIIGTVEASGVGGGTPIYKDGTVSRTQGTNSSMVITHGLGVIPSIVLFYIADPVKSTMTYISSAIGCNDAMLAALGGGYINKVNVVASGGVMSLGANTGIEHGPMDSLREACIRYADENTFTVGNDTYKVMSGYNYSWIAIGGVV